MERDERTLADDLDRYWDALLRAETVPAPDDLDSDLATLVTRLHEAGSALPTLIPDPSQTWRELRQGQTPPPPRWGDREMVFPGWPHPNGHADGFAEGPQATPLPRRSGGRFLSQLATAALLLLTLVMGFAAISQSVPEATNERSWVPALAPALASAPGVVDTPLVETTFTPAELPAGEKEAVYYRLTIAPGASLTYLGGMYCSCRDVTITKGVGIEIVQSGRYAVRLNAPLRVLRAGATGPGEEISAGTEVTLATGDALIYPDYAVAGDIRNAGDSPVTITGLVINAMEVSWTPLPKLPTGVHVALLANSTPSDLETLGPGPLHVGLRLVTLPAETHIGPYIPVGLQAMRVESGTILRNFLSAGETSPRWRPLPQKAGMTASFVAPAPGLRETLDVEGDQPAEMLVLIIEPAVSSIRSLVQ